MSATAADNLAILPESVLFVFQQLIDGNLQSEPYTLTVALEDLELGDYQLENGTYLAGFPGSKVFHPSILATTLTPATDPANLTTLTNLTTQYATDWYTWQEAKADLTLVGYPDWILTGLEDHAEFHHGDEALTLRLQRGPWFDPREEIFYYGPIYTPPLVLPPCSSLVAPVCGQLCWDGTYFRLWDCYNWQYFCQCIPVTGSGPLPSCIPAECSLCTDPPETWAITAAGFTGICDLFNGDWTLDGVSACLWKDSAIVGSLEIVVSILLDSGVHTLTLTAVDNDGVTIVAQATYTIAADDLPDCCVSLVFADPDCSCDVPEVPPGVDCAQCTTTPLIWKATVSGCTGCFVRFNGTWTMTQNDPCTWIDWDADAAGLMVRWSMLSDGSGDLTLVDVLSGLSAAAHYTTGDLSLDCCTPVTADLLVFSCDDEGTVPDTVTMTPLCPVSGGGDTGSCPDTLTAVPDCCGESPPNLDPGCDCTQCPNGTVPRWTFTLVDPLGDFHAGAGDWTLNLDSGCTWSGSKNGLTAQLTYDDEIPGAWCLRFDTTGVSYQRFRLSSPFNCCGANLFVFTNQAGDYGGFGYAALEVILSPQGPCTPCEDTTGGTISTSCCADILVPATLRVTFSNGTGDCTCLNGQFVDVVNGGFAWDGSKSLCAYIYPTDVHLLCSGVGWFIGLSTGCTGTAASSSATCTPFQINFTGVTLGGCCTGAIDMTVTAAP